MHVMTYTCAQMLWSVRFHVLLKIESHRFPKQITYKGEIYAECKYFLKMYDSYSFPKNYTIVNNTVFSFQKTWLNCTNNACTCIEFVGGFCSYDFLISQYTINLTLLSSLPTGTVCFHWGGQCSVFEGDSPPDKYQINQLYRSH